MLCFNQYTLEAGEKKRWPVAFVIDPKISKDVCTITLSHTFEVGGRTSLIPTAAVLQVPRGPTRERATERAAAQGIAAADRYAVGWGFFGVRKDSAYQEDRPDSRRCTLLPSACRRCRSSSGWCCWSSSWLPS